MSLAQDGLGLPGSTQLPSTHALPSMHPSINPSASQTLPAASRSWRQGVWQVLVVGGSEDASKHSPAEHTSPVLQAPAPLHWQPAEPSSQYTHTPCFGSHRFPALHFPDGRQAPPS
jgi:hypothetical protein